MTIVRIPGARQLAVAATDTTLEVLGEVIEHATKELIEDGDYWTELACGQDTEQAEESGRLAGRVEGLEEARELVRVLRESLQGL